MALFNSFARIPWLAARQRFWPLPRIGVLEEDRVRMRVWPNDIDFNLHLNNGRYLTVMDYGRMHLLARIGMLDLVVTERWMPLVGSVWITYRRSLPAMASYILSTRLVCWDDKWFYMEQIFAGAQGLAAIGLVKGLLRGNSGNLAPQKVLDRIAPGVISPPIPEAFTLWNEMTRDKLQRGEAI